MKEGKKILDTMDINSLINELNLDSNESSIITDNSVNLVNNTLSNTDRIEWEKKFNCQTLKKRIYFLRHYPYVEDNLYNIYNFLLWEKVHGNISFEWNEIIKKIARISWIEEDLWLILDKLSKKLKIHNDLDNIKFPTNLKDTYRNIFNSDKIAIFYDQSDNENRVSLTADNLISTFSDNLFWKGVIKHGFDSWLKQSKKWLSWPISQWVLMTDFLEFVNSREYLSVFHDPNIETIVILSNRSHTNGFMTNIAGDLELSSRTNMNTLENEGFLYVDHWINRKWELEVIYDNSLILQIKPNNYNDIIAQLEWLNLIDSHDNIQDYQNKLNEVLYKSPSTIKQIINSVDNLHWDLLLFAIKYLIYLKEFNFIELILDKIVLNLEWKRLLDFIEILIKNTPYKYACSYLTIIRDNWKLHSDFSHDSYIYYLQYISSVSNDIKDLRSKSLDPRIHAEDKAFITTKFSNWYYDDIKNLVEIENIVIIEAPAWYWKSTLLLKIMEYLSPEINWESCIFPIYINLQHKSILELETELDRRKFNFNGAEQIKFLYLLDACDESEFKWEDMDDFISIINNLNSWVIITSRSWCLKENNFMEKYEKKEQETLYIQECKEKQEGIYYEKYCEEFNKVVEDENNLFASMIDFKEKFPIFPSQVNLFERKWSNIEFINILWLDNDTTIEYIDLYFTRNPNNKKKFKETYIKLFGYSYESKSSKLSFHNELNISTSVKFNNPLVLSMICMLIDEWSDLFNPNIPSLYDLYNAAIDMMLKKWCKFKKVDISEDILEVRKNILSEIAFKYINNNYSISQQEIDELLNSSILYKVSIKNSLSSLSIILKKTNNWEYSFIHSTFAEFLYITFFEEKFINNKWLFYSKIIGNLDLREIYLRFKNINLRKRIIVDRLIFRIHDDFIEKRIISDYYFDKNYLEDEKLKEEDFIDNCNLQININNYHKILWLIHKLSWKEKIDLISWVLKDPMINDSMDIVEHFFYDIFDFRVYLEHGGSVEDIWYMISHGDLIGFEEIEKRLIIKEFLKNIHFQNNENIILLLIRILWEYEINENIELIFIIMMSKWFSNNDHAQKLLLISCYYKEGTKFSNTLLRFFFSMDELATEKNFHYYLRLSLS